MWGRTARRGRAIAMVVAVVGTAISCHGSWRANPAVCGTHAQLDRERARYEAALAKARTWLEGLRIDPIELRQHGLKGKKKLVEMLGVYYRLWRVADAPQKAAVLTSIRQLVAVTYDARYHDMLAVDDTTFKQDATSYLRAALLMERIGLDTTLYREEIAKAHDRLNRHMATRGPNQRRIFHWYYQHFGLAEPFPLAKALDRGTIARRVDPARMKNAMVYDLTHEVFGPYEYGDRLDADPFDEGDKQYLRRTLARLIPRYVFKSDPDLVAELVSCARYLGIVDVPEYHMGLAFLLDSQNPDGSWGNAERARAQFGDYGPHGILLHTTHVAVDALSIAFHEPWNREAFAACRAGGCAARGR